MQRNFQQRFGQRIKSLRHEYGWTQVDLAAKSGVGRVFISQVENGHKDVCLGVMDALAGCFKISLSDLLKKV